MHRTVYIPTDFVTTDDLYSCIFYYISYTCRKKRCGRRLFVCKNRRLSCLCFFPRSEMTVLHCTANTVILFPYTRFYFVTYYIIAFLSVSQRYDILLISTHNRRVVIIILTYYRADKLWMNCGSKIIQYNLANHLCYFFYTYSFKLFNTFHY